MNIEYYKDGVIKIDGNIYTLSDALRNFPKDIKQICYAVNKYKKEVEENDKISQDKNTKLIKEIQDKTKIILNQLGLDKENSFFDKISKIFDYIVQNSDFEESLLQEKKKIYDADLSLIEKYKTMEINDIYNCLIKNRSVCTGDATTMAYLLRCVGIDATHATIGNSKATKLHEIVLIRFMGYKLYCEPTIYREALHNDIVNLNGDKFVFEEKEYKKYLRANRMSILQIYDPIYFTDKDNVENE